MVSSTTFSGGMVSPKNLDATSAAVRLRSSRLPSVTIVALVAIACRSRFAFS